MQTIGEWWMWVAFAAFVVVAVAVDIVMLRAQGAHKVTAREAVLWSLAWMVLALGFCGGLWLWLDATAGRAVADVKATEFLTGYLIEWSLSVDNIFVFLMIFGFFAVPSEFQKRVLVIGILGAIVLRTIMIVLGGLLIARFHWILYLFGAFLVFTGIKMLLFADHAPDLEKNPLLRWMRRHLRITPEHHGERFAIVRDGRRWFTPLFAVLVLVALTDVIFAVDSIPAIYAITEDPFIVMTANIFAVLGLRALFFLLADMKDRFHLLTYGLAIVLLFVGAKMLLSGLIHLSALWSLGVVVGILGTSIFFSLVRPPQGPGGGIPTEAKG